MIDLETPIDSVPLAFLDVETTGLNPAFGDRVCEVAILRCEGDVALDALQQLVNPGRSVSPGAFAVNGISDEMLASAPTFAQVMDHVLELLDGAALVGHNTAFDLGFLAAELADLGLSLPTVPALDTMRLARNTCALRSYSLGSVAHGLSVTIDGRAHRAMNDVLLTRGVFLKLVDQLWRRGVRTLGQYLATQGGSVSVQPARKLDVPPLIREALSRDALLRVRYLSDGGVLTERLVRPLRVVEQAGHVSLVAHCHLRDARRNFRLDRIQFMEIVLDAE